MLFIWRECCSWVNSLNIIKNYSHNELLKRYTKEFPSEVVSGWSSGTGMAGVFGAGFYIFTTSINFPDNFLFLFYIPFVILSYIYCFRSLENKRIKYK